MSSTTEAFARVKIDALLKDAGWNVADGTSVLFEHTLPDRTRSGYVLCDRAGCPMAALEAKHAGIDPSPHRTRVGTTPPKSTFHSPLSNGGVFLRNGTPTLFRKWDTQLRSRNGCPFGFLIGIEVGTDAFVVAERHLTGDGPVASVAG